MSKEDEVNAGGGKEPVGYKVTEDGSVVPDMKKVSGPHFEDVGGLEEQIKTIKELILEPLQYGKLYRSVGAERTHGILIHGPVGSGKTLLAKAILNEMFERGIIKSRAEPVDCGAIYSSNPDVLIKNLWMAFGKAQEKGNQIFVLDDIDLIVPGADGSPIRIERSGDIVAAELGLVMENSVQELNGMLVIGITSNIDRLNKDLRRDGRFEVEIGIPVPDKEARVEIINILMKNKPRSKNFDAEAIAELTQGYTGADLHALLKEASLIAIKSAIRRDKEHSSHDEQKVRLTQANVLSALKKVKPSLLEGSKENIPDVKWDDVGGLEKVKAEILEAVELPLTDPKAFEEYGIRPPKGFLFYGAPGTGKTYLAKAIANRCHANFIPVNVTELFNKWVGESEAKMRSIFEKARSMSPCIVFIDEIDAIGGTRDGSNNDGGVREKILDALLIELDGMKERGDVILIAATNRPDLLDSALTRPGRFDKLIEIPMPDEAARVEILKVHTAKMPLDKDVDIQAIAKHTDKYSGADIENLCRESGIIAMRKRKAMHTVSMDDFMEALKEIRPSMDSSHLRLYNLKRGESKPEIGFRRPESAAVKRTVI